MSGSICRTCCSQITNGGACRNGGKQNAFHSPRRKRYQKQAQAASGSPQAPPCRWATQANGMSSGTKCCLMPRNGPHWPEHGAGSRRRGAGLLAWVDDRSMRQLGLVLQCRRRCRCGDARRSSRPNETQVENLSFSHISHGERGSGAWGTGTGTRTATGSISQDRCSARGSKRRLIHVASKDQRRQLPLCQLSRSTSHSSMLLFPRFHLHFLN